MARGSYQKENESTFLSPYVISSNLEISHDFSRRQFLHTYLNQYVALLEDNVFMSDEMQEFNYNLQLMLYCHVWESHYFLANLRRIVAVLDGQGYVWRIPFERLKKKNSSEMIPIPRGKFLKENVIEPFKKLDDEIGNLLSVIYDNTIRNGYSHSMYMVNMKSRSVEILMADTYSTEKIVEFSDWEKKFCYSVLLSYYLSKELSDRLNRFVYDYPNMRYVKVKIPSILEPGEIKYRNIYPHKIEDNEKTYVSFCFSDPKQ